MNPSRVFSLVSPPILPFSLSRIYYYRKYVFVPRANGSLVRKSCTEACGFRESARAGLGSSGLCWL